MATKIWLGGAAAIAQVNSWTFAGTWEADDVIRITIGSKTYDFTAGSTTISTIVSTLVTAYNALDSTVYPEFAEMTASAPSSSVFRLTADTAGKPFVATITPLEANLGTADSQTIEGGTSATTGTATTANAGPNCWDTAANWSSSGVPASSDDVYFQGNNVSCLYGLAQSAVTLTSLTIDQSYTGDIGLKDHTGVYSEYRDKELAISATTLTVGKGEGAGSSLLRINVGSNACTLLVFNTGTSAESGLGALRWRGTSASNTATLSRGIVDIAYAAGHTANLTGGLNVGYRTSPEGDVILRLGSGVTLATINKSGGIMETNSAVTTLTQTGGTTNHLAGGMTTLTCRGGTVNYNSTGTLATGTVSGFGVLDFSQDMRTKTVTNPIERYGDDSEVRDPFKVVTGLVVDCNESTNLAKLQIGSNVRITRGTPA